MKHLLLAVAVLSIAAVARAEGGAEVFAKKCVVCHGKDGKGTVSGHKMGAKDLTATKLSEADIQGVVSSGKGMMTPFKGKLTDAEIASVAKYVKGGLK